jgi:hypothetical protein
MLQIIRLQRKQQASSYASIGWPCHHLFYLAMDEAASIHEESGRLATAVLEPPLTWIGFHRRQSPRGETHVSDLRKKNVPQAKQKDLREWPNGYHSLLKNLSNTQELKPTPIKKPVN